MSVVRDKSLKKTHSITLLSLLWFFCSCFWICVKGCAGLGCVRGGIGWVVLWGRKEGDLETHLILEWICFEHHPSAFARLGHWRSGCFLDLILWHRWSIWEFYFPGWLNQNRESFSLDGVAVSECWPPFLRRRFIAMSGWGGFVNKPRLLVGAIYPSWKVS